MGSRPCPSGQLITGMPASLHKQTDCMFAIVSLSPLSPGYLKFLLSLSPLLQEWQLLLNAHVAKQTVVPLATPLPDHSAGVVGLGLSKNVEEDTPKSPVKPTQEPMSTSEDTGGSTCVVS